MKIGFTGMDLPEGKVKYRDENLVALEEKDKPKKVSPFYVEFMRDEFVHSEAIIIPKSRVLDLLILDMEKVETRLNRSTDNDEKTLMKKCMAALERETPLCDIAFDDKELKMLKTTAPLSLKPVVQIESPVDIKTLIEMAINKAGYIFFYTSGPSESHAWLVKKGSNIVTCAGKIHTDLARGFIKGDVVSFEDYMNCHNFNECKSKRLARLTDSDYIVQSSEIIEIRFNV